MSSVFPCLLYPPPFPPVVVFLPYDVDIADIYFILHHCLIQFMWHVSIRYMSPDRFFSSFQSCPSATFSPAHVYLLYRVIHPPMSTSWTEPSTHPGLPLVHSRPPAHVYLLYRAIYPPKSTYCAESSTSPCLPLVQINPPAHVYLSYRLIHLPMSTSCTESSTCPSLPLVQSHPAAHVYHVYRLIYLPKSTSCTD